MKLKFCYICPIILLCTDVLGMKWFNRDYNYGQRRNYFQKSNESGSNRKYNGNNYQWEFRPKRRRDGYNNYDYTDYERGSGSKRRRDGYNNRDYGADYEAGPRSTYRKSSYNTPDFYKREIKRYKVLDEEREGTEALFSNYKYEEAINFFKEVGESESSYPTLIWDDDEIDLKRLYKVDFGEFDQRKKFIDMFENYDGKGLSISIRVDFSYGGLRHDMFIEQPEKSREYSTDKFLFQNCVTFGEEQPLDYVPYTDYVKPYLSKRDKSGILAKFIKYPEKIQKFAVNVSRIMKLSPKGILSTDVGNFGIDRVLTFESFEVAGMILSTERLRSKKSLLLSCIEFYKLKHTADQEDGLSMLLDMFDKDGPILRFPASPGGIEYIQKTHPYYIYKRFLDMVKYSPEYPIIQQCKNRDMQLELMNKFFHGKLEKIRAVLENRQPKFKSEFKSAVKNYLQGLNTSPTKEIKTDTPSCDASSSNPKSDTVLPNESSFKDTNNTAQKVENNPGEYFDDNSNDFADADYDSIFKNAVSSELGSSQQSKVEDNPDEYFDDYSNDFADADYDSIFKNAVSSELGSSQQSKVENNSDEYFGDYLNDLADADYDSIFNNAIQQSKFMDIDDVNKDMSDAY